MDLDEILTLVEDEEFFIVHAPRQTGKTSILLALADRLNRSGEYRCVYVNVETGQAARHDTARAMRTILGELGETAINFLGDSFVSGVKAKFLDEFGPDSALKQVLAH